MYSPLKVVFCWRFFFLPTGVPFVYDDQFSTRLAVMFPQSLGFYMLIHSMAVLNCSFHNSGSLFSSRQNILKSQPSSFSQLVFVCLGLRRTTDEGGSLYRSSGACDLVHSILWFTFTFLRFAFWVPRNHSPPPAPRYYSFQQLPLFLKSLWDPTYPSKSPT